MAIQAFVAVNRTALIVVLSSSARIRLAGRVPEGAVLIDLECARGQAGEPIGDGRPGSATGRRSPDATIGTRRVHVSGRIGSQTRDPPGNETGPTTGVGVVVAIGGIVRVVRDAGHVRPRSAGGGQPGQLRECRAIGTRRDDTARSRTRLRELVRGSLRLEGFAAGAAARLTLRALAEFLLLLGQPGFGVGILIAGVCVLIAGAGVFGHRVEVLDRRAWQSLGLVGIQTPDRE